MAIEGRAGALLGSEGAPHGAPLYGQIRRALRYLYDLPYLHKHPLARLLAGETEDHATNAGKALQRQLVDAIERLRPAGEGAGAGRMLRRYELMRLRHIEGKEVEEVQQELGIGHGEYYRLLNEGLEAVVQLIAGRLPEAGAAAPGAEPETSPAGGEPAGGPGWGPLRVSTPLVGRREELGFLEAQYEAAARGEGGRLFLVSGEAGVGKTRLVQELGRYAQERGGAFLEGRWAWERGQPYRAWTEALGAGLRELGREEMAAALGPYGQELAQLLPQIVEPAAAPVGAPRADAEQQRLRLYDGVFGLILHLSRRRPLVLLLDDLHWAASMFVLLHVARRLRETRALVVAAYRDQELSEKSELVLARSELHRARLYAPIDLAPLSAEHTSQMVAHTFGDEAGSQLGRAVHAMTHGNPFFVEEVLSSLVEKGAVRRGGARWEVADASLLTLPESVQLIVRERVTRLGEGATAVLQQAAVLGQEFSLPVLVAMAGLPEEQVEREVDRAVSAGLLVDRSSTAEERFAFRDGQVWEVLYGTISTVRRRRYHKLAGEALEAVYEARIESSLEELAHHFTEGHDSDRAARYSFRAGQKASAVFLWTRAIPYFRDALELWEELGGHLEERAATYERLGDACYKSGIEAPKGMGYLQQALDLYRQVGNRHKMATIHSQLGREHMDSANLKLRNQQEALRHFDLARSLLEQEAEGMARGLVQCGLALACLYRLDCQRAEWWARSAFRVGERLASPALLANARVPLGVAHVRLGEVDAGLGILALGWQTASEHQLGFQADLIRSWGSHLGVSLKSPEVGFRWAEWPGQEEHQTAHSALDLRCHLTGLWALKGELGRARQLCAELEELLTALGQPTFGPWPSDMGLLWLRAGEWDRARGLLEAGLQWAKGSHNSQVAAFTAQVLGQVCLETGNFRGAEEHLQWGLGLFREGGDLLGQLGLLPHLAEVYARLGDVTKAQAHLDEAEGILLGSRDWLARPQDWGGLPGDVYLARGMVRALQGRHDEADAAFQRGIESHRAHGLPWDEARTCYEWGCARAGRGDSRDEAARARDLLGRALVLWEPMGAGPYVDACRARLASLS